jgi:hypothetical protein
MHRGNNVSEVCGTRFGRGRFNVEVMGCVSTGRELAVKKFIHGKRWKKQLIVKEYQILSAVIHSSIVECLELCRNALLYCGVMEWYVVETSMSCLHGEFSLGGYYYSMYVVRI